jgi:hypothetical protein
MSDDLMDRIPADDEAPGGLFPTWESLYVSLVVYGVICIVVLYLVTQLLNVNLPGGGMGG